MLTVAGDEVGGAAIDGRSLLDKIAREGARRMLLAALETEIVTGFQCAASAIQPDLSPLAP